MDVTSALKEAIGSVLEEVRKVPPVQTQNPTQHVVLHQAEAPRPPPWHVWLCATGAIVAVIVAAGAVYVASQSGREVQSLRAEMATRLEAAQTRHEADVRELRQKDGALQAYINAGKVPAQPRK